MKTVYNETEFKKKRHGTTTQRCKMTTETQNRDTERPQVTQTDYKEMQNDNKKETHDEKKDRK